MIGWVERMSNLTYALGRRRAADARTRWSRDQLHAWQQDRLSRLVTHATERSRFHRERFGGVVRGPVALESIPVVTKDQMMDRFDDFVTDPRLRLAELLAHAEKVRGDELYLGELRVMVSSGSSGRKGLFVWDRRTWREVLMCANLRMTAAVGLSPRLPRPRLATVAASDGKHMTFRGGVSMDVGVYRTRRFSAAWPLPQLVAALASWQPEFLLGYPSMLALLAEEQLAGRLRITPNALLTSSEVRTEGMARAIEAAWGVRPIDVLGLTETGITAVECAAHRGLHLQEDLSIVEVVDEANRPVPDGQPGARILVTNLFNEVQPILRYEVSDLVTISSDPCPCGCTFRRIVALDGRSDDVLELPGPGGAVRVHPIRIRSALGANRAVIQYQVVQTAEGLDVAVVPARDAPADLTTAVGAELRATLRQLGADVTVAVRALDAIPREAGPAKLKLVRARA